METLHWISLALAVAGVALVLLGIQEQRGARPSRQVVGGFGGPPGSSDVGAPEGFGAPSPTAHFAVGRTWRLAGLALVVVALVLVVVDSLT